MSTKNLIRIILADDHFFFRQGFKKFMDSSDATIKFIAEASNGMELLELVDKHKPDVVITDVRMPVLDGILACKMITEKYPIPVIAFSGFDDDQYLVDMISAGAAGLVSKNASREEINESIHTVHRGLPYCCSLVTNKISQLNIKFRTQQSKKTYFTPQEIRIMQLICKQYTSKEITSILNLSIRTIEDYRHRLQEKTGTRNMVGIALYAFINGFINAKDL